MDCQGHRQRPGGGITANQLHIVIIQLFKQGIAEGFKPGFIHLRQGQRQRQPGRVGAHCRQIANVYRQRLIRQVGRIDIGQEVTPTY